MGPLLSIVLFLLAGGLAVAVSLAAGRLLRPRVPGPEKSAIYECGEPSLGPSRVRFDLRFYVVALFFLVFDVEIALIYPWAVVFREVPATAIAVGAPFLAIVVVGFAYEWWSGGLDWVGGERDADKSN